MCFSYKCKGYFGGGVLNPKADIGGGGCEVEPAVLRVVAVEWSASRADGAGAGGGIGWCGAGRICEAVAYGGWGRGGGGVRTAWVGELQCGVIYCDHPQRSGSFLKAFRAD